MATQLRKLSRFICTFMLNHKTVSGLSLVTVGKPTVCNMTLNHVGLRQRADVASTALRACVPGGKDCLQSFYDALRRRGESPECAPSLGINLTTPTESPCFTGTFCFLGETLRRQLFANHRGSKSRQYWPMKRFCIEKHMNI